MELAIIPNVFAWGPPLPPDYEVKKDFDSLEYGNGDCSSANTAPLGPFLNGTSMAAKIGS